MSILIKNMTMPKGNDELRLIIHSNGQVIISHQTYYEEAEAVPVPPHGRLGDLDELKTAFPCGESIRTESVRATIDHTPTIVPADKDNNVLCKKEGE